MYKIKSSFRLYLTYRFKKRTKVTFIKSIHFNFGKVLQKITKNNSHNRQ